MQVLINEGLYSEGLKEKCLSVYRNHEPDIHLYAGVEDRMKEIHKSGLDIGIITDGRAEGQHRKINALGLSQWWMPSSLRMSWVDQNIGNRMERHSTS